MTPSRTLGASPRFDTERYAWTRRRAVRRSGVVVEVVLFLVLAAAALWAAYDVADRGIGEIGIAVLFLLFIPVHSVVNLGVRGVFDRRAATLDEAQRTMRDRSLAAVHPARIVLGLVAVLAAVYVALHAPVPGQAYLLGFVLWFAAWMLSSWHLAWTLPDEPADLVD
ncbi:hypothetical protein [Actinomycetospora sp. CA-084318]|uniref:hypothetical protein n=1 Tax=Actinomycetospora sp. CA-084318 TaxID=3239892 RepID=UPI003D96AF39